MKPAITTTGKSAAPAARKSAPARPVIDIMKLKPTTGPEALKRYRERTGRPGIAEMSFHDAGLRPGEL